jgi:hypothetical protein
MGRWLQQSARTLIATKFMNNETVEYSDPATKSVFFPVKVIDKENVGQFLQK